MLLGKKGLFLHRVLPNQYRPEFFCKSCKLGKVKFGCDINLKMTFYYLARL